MDLYSSAIAAHVEIANSIEESVMSARVASLALAFALLLFVGANPVLAATHHATAESRAAEARALRAQIDRMDTDLQAMQAQIYQLEHNPAVDPTRKTKQSSLRAQIHRMDREQELLENRLREIEHEDPAIAAESMKDSDDAGATQHYASPAIPPRPAAVHEMAVSSGAVQLPPQLGPTLRQAADPVLYEKAAGSRVAMFRYNSYRWVPVGTRQLAIYNTYDEAYLLDFASDCPGLLHAERIKVENFSTKVVAGRDAVNAAGQRCPIADIRELNINRLPRER
jgi:hypothetical protein